MTTCNDENGSNMSPTLATEILLNLLTTQQLTEHQQAAIQTIVATLIDRPKQQSYEKMPLDKHWLAGSFECMEDMYASADYFHRYFEQYCDQLEQRQLQQVHSILKHFIVDQVDVIFKPKEEYPQQMIQIRYGSSTLEVLIPDDLQQSEEDKEKIRNHYHTLYMNQLKESQIRTNALLWYMLAEPQRTKIRLNFKQGMVETT